MKQTNLILCTILLIVSLSVICCGPSYEERKEREEAQRQESIKLATEKEQAEISEIQNKFGAVYFPPPELNGFSYSIEIQKFFSDNENKPILFKGYLEDIEELNGVTYVTFFSPISDSYKARNLGIKAKLSIDKMKILPFLKIDSRKRVSSLYRFGSPDYYIIARIKECKISILYKTNPYNNDEEVEIDFAVERNHLVTGEFIESINRIKE